MDYRITVAIGSRGIELSSFPIDVMVVTDIWLITRSTHYIILRVTLDCDWMRGFRINNLKLILFHDCRGMSPKMILLTATS